MRVPGAVAFAGTAVALPTDAVAIATVPAVVVPIGGVGETAPVEAVPVVPVAGEAIAAITAVAGADPAMVGTGRGVALAIASVGGGMGDALGTGVTVTIASLLHAESNMLRQARNGTRK